MRTVSNNIAHTKFREETKYMHAYAARTTSENERNARRRKRVCVSVTTGEIGIDGYEIE